MFKLFTKVTTTRLEKKLYENQTREQTEFRSKCSTTKYIHATNQLKANIYAISSDTHQLQLIKLHHFKLEIFKSI